MNKIEMLNNIIRGVMYPYRNVNLENFSINEAIEKTGTPQIKKFFEPLILVQKGSLLLVKYNPESPIFIEHKYDFFADSFYSGIYSECNSIVFNLRNVINYAYSYDNIVLLPNPKTSDNNYIGKILDIAKENYNKYYHYEIDLINDLEGKTVLARMWGSDRLAIAIDGTLPNQDSEEVKIIKSLIDQKMLRNYRGHTFIYKFIDPADKRYEPRECGLRLTGAIALYIDKKDIISPRFITTNTNSFATECITAKSFEEFKRDLQIILKYVGPDCKGCNFHLNDVNYEIKTRGYF